MIKNTLLLFNLKVLAFGVLFIIGYGNYSHAQQKGSAATITGMITDATTHEPLIGVSVRVAGTNKATISDLDGKYTIGVDPKDKELTYSYVGYLTITEKINDRKAINIFLSEDSQMLEDVVVIGYGIQKKSHLTGSITKVELDGLGDIPSSNVGEALKGKIAGVQIQNLSGEVGVEPSIRVRGTASISASASPLIIIDGFPSSEGLDALNMGDVESIEVLKDAASAAIYGSRAANGVIIITTKNGEVNKPKYSLKTSLAIKNPYKLHPIMSSADYVDMVVNESLLKGSKLPDAEFAFSTMTNNTDWQDVGTRTANLYSTQLSISGGSKEVKYYVSGGYVSDEGIMVNNDYERMNLRAKVDATLSKRVKIGINLAPSYGKRERPTTNFIDFYRTPSWMPVRHTEETAALTGREVGEYAHGAHFNGREYTGIHPITGEMTTLKVSPYNTQNHNPMAILENDRQKQKDYRLQANTYVDVQIMDGLTFRSSNGVSYGYRETNRYRNLNARKEGETNWGQYGNALTLDLLNENTLSYAKTWNTKHDFTGLLGFSNELIKDSRAGIEAVGFPTDYIRTLNAAGEILHYGSSGNIATGTWKSDETLVSAFSRLSYSYDQKYLVSASVRTDGSSKFGKSNKWAWFPSVSLGWRLTEEKFMKDNVKWMNQAKFRLSYGITGNKEIGNYNNTNLLSPAPYPTGAGNGNIETGIGNLSKTLGNDRLQWEQTNEYNIGADFSFFHSRLGLNVDYYYSTTKSLLYQRNISSISGYQQKWTNQGKIRNKGLEIEVSSHNIRNKDFTWTTSVNFSLNRNKILDLGGEPYLINQGERNETYLSEVGGKSIQFYGFKTNGVWTSQEEIDNNPHSKDDAPGGMRPVDTNDDKVINDQDRVVIGDPLPDFTWGVTNTVKYKGFDLSFLFQGVEGVDVINGDWFYNETKRWHKKYVSNRWISPEHIGDGQTPYYNNGRNIMLTDKAVEDASYIALRDITIGYQLPKKLLKKTIFSKVRVYANAQNLGYWITGNYRGINPEARHNSGVYNHPLIDGYQRGAFPIERTFSFGIDVNF